MIKYIKFIIKKVIQATFFLLPIKKNRIVFENFNGKGYGDNPKYIAEELYSRDLNLELVWLVHNQYKQSIPNYIKSVNMSSVKAYYMAATAKVWVDNVRNAHLLKKKKKQIFLQTWHGGLGLKKIEKDIEDLLDYTYLKSAKRDGKICNGIIVSCPWHETIFKNNLWLNDNVEYLRIGLPRNDQLINDYNNEEKIKRLKKKYGIKDNSYYILYAPTFRDDNSIEGYKLDFNTIIKELNNKFKKDCYIIIKLHPNAIELSNFIKYNEHIINGSSYSDILELSLVCDCIISDFSSCLFDFAMLKKDGYICALDYNEYTTNRRIHEDIFMSVPFPIAYSNEQLIDNIRNFDRVKYLQNLKAFYEKNPLYDDGNASKKAADWILKKMED